MKKEKEEMFEEICKNKALKGYVTKKLALILVFSMLTLSLSAIRFFEDKTNWEYMCIGVLLIIYSVWCFIEVFAELKKFGQINDKKDDE